MESLVQVIIVLHFRGEKSGWHFYIQSRIGPNPGITRDNVYNGFYALLEFAMVDVGLSFLLIITINDTPLIPSELPV